MSPPACTGTGCQGVPGAAADVRDTAECDVNGVGIFPPPTPTSKPKAKAKRKAAKCKKGDVRAKGKRLRHDRCVKQAVRSGKSAKSSARRHGSLWRKTPLGAKFSTAGSYAAGAVQG